MDKQNKHTYLESLNKDWLLNGKSLNGIEIKIIFTLGSEPTFMTVHKISTEITEEETTDENH